MGPENGIEWGHIVPHVAPDEPVNVVMRGPFEDAGDGGLPLSRGLAAAEHKEVRFVEDPFKNCRSHKGRIRLRPLLRHACRIKQRVTGTPEHIGDHGMARPIPIG